MLASRDETSDEGLFPRPVFTLSKCRLGPPAKPVRDTGLRQSSCPGSGESPKKKKRRRLHLVNVDKLLNRKDWMSSKTSFHDFDERISRLENDALGDRKDPEVSAPTSTLDKNSQNIAGQSSHSLHWSSSSDEDDSPRRMGKRPPVQHTPSISAARENDLDVSKASCHAHKASVDMILSDDLGIGRATESKLAKPSAGSRDPSSVEQPEELFLVVDGLYKQIENPNLITVGGFIKKVRATWPRPLEPDARMLIKNRLKDLLNGRVNPAQYTSSYESQGKSLHEISSSKNLAKYSSQVNALRHGEKTKDSCKFEASTENSESRLPVSNQPLRVADGSSFENHVASAPEDPTSSARGQIIAPINATRSSSKCEARPKSTKRRKKQNCALCATCPCRKSCDAGDTSPADFQGRSHTERSIERALIRRFQKLEKTAEHLEDQKESVRGRLKRLRRDMWKKKIAGNEASDATTGALLFDGSRFMPDASSLSSYPMAKMRGVPQQLVTTAKTVLMESEQRLYQPTLTQLVTDEASSIEKVGEDDEREQPTAHVASEIPNLPMDGKEGEPMISHAEEAISWLEKDPGAASASSFRVKWGVTDHTNECFDLSPSTIDDGLQQAIQAPWDNLFQHGAYCDEDLNFSMKLVNEGLDSLVGGGMEHIARLCGDDAASGGSGDYSPATFSQLSPSRRASGLKFIGEISENQGEVSKFEAICSNWKENMAFVWQQSDPASVEGALCQVRTAVNNVKSRRAQILEELDKHESVLRLFESALSSRMTELQ